MNKIPHRKAPVCNIHITTIHSTWLHQTSAYRPLPTSPLNTDITALWWQSYMAPNNIFPVTDKWLSESLPFYSLFFSILLLILQLTVQLFSCINITLVTYNSSTIRLGCNNSIHNYCVFSKVLHPPCGNKSPDWSLAMFFFLSDKLTLTVYVNESGMLHSLWNQTGTQGRVWHKTTLDYGASEQYQVCPILPLRNLQSWPDWI